MRRKVNSSNGFMADSSVKKKRKAGARALAYIALGAVLIVLCAWASIPFAIPITLQLFGVFCCLELLGGRNGTIAIAVYLALGAAGLPVFAGFVGGFGALVGVTGGYLWGMLAIGLLYWLGTAAAGTRTAVRAALLIAGLLVCYAIGTAWFMNVQSLSGSKVGLWAALGSCVLPFIPFDLAKLVGAMLIAKRIKPHIGSAA